MIQLFKLLGIIMILLSILINILELSLIGVLLSMFGMFLFVFFNYIEKSKLTKYNLFFIFILVCAIVTSYVYGYTNIPKTYITSNDSCYMCGGSGLISSDYSDPNSFIINSKTCPICDGTGKKN